MLKIHRYMFWLTLSLSLSLSLIAEACGIFFSTRINFLELKRSIYQSPHFLFFKVSNLFFPFALLIPTRFYRSILNCIITKFSIYILLHLGYNGWYAIKAEHLGIFTNYIIYPNNVWLVWFLYLKAYQHSWVIWYQSHLCRRTVVVLFNS